MRAVRDLTILAAAGTALAACSPPRAQDIAFYRSHAAERTARLAACRSDRGRLAATADCINALAADSEDSSRRFWSAPAPAPRVRDGAKL